MDVQHFEKCIRYISGKYQVVLLEELMNVRDSKRKGKFATISFDDGYKDNIEFALPILDKYKCKVSFYVVTDCIDHDRPTWTHILEHRFEHTACSVINLSFDFLPADLQTRKLANSSHRMEYIVKLRPFLKTLSHAQRTAVLEEVNRSFHDVQIPSMMMNWTDLKQLKNAGHYIGSHTVSHSMLATMDNEADIMHELTSSAKIIEKNLGHFPLSLAYPIGNYNERTIELCKAAGYKIGIAVGRRIYDHRNESAFEVPRIELFNEPWWKTKLRITNRLEDIKKIAGY